MNPYFDKAFELARKAAQFNEVPVGAVVVRKADSTIIAATSNAVEAAQDATAHAEILAIQQASNALQNKFLNDCDLYVTLEPCAMCASAISHARIDRLYFAAFDPKMGAVEHGTRFFESTICHHKPEVYGGLCQQEGQELMQEFFRKKRD